MAKETIKVVQIDTNPAQTSIKDLRQQLKGFKDEMANLEEGSDAFLEIANKAGEVKHQIDEINESIKGASADFGDMIGNTTNVAAGITGAFQAAQGAMQAFGVESEIVTQSIAKLQGLMAMTQGLAAIDDGIKSFGKMTTAIKTSTSGLGKFKTALIGTGLGALVVVLGSIVANWDEFSKSIGISEQAMTKFGDIMKGVLNSALGMIGGVGKAISRLITGDFKGAGEAIKEGFAVQKNYQAGVIKSENERTENARKAAEERKRIAQEEAQKKIDEAKRVLEAERAKEQERIDIELERLKRSGKSEEEQLKEQIRLEKERLKTYQEGTIEYERQLTKIHELNEELNKPVEEPKQKTPKEDKPIKVEIDAENEKLKELAKSYYTLEETAAETYARISDELKLALDRDLISQEQYDEAVKNLANERARYIAKQSVAVFAAASNAVTGILDDIASSQDTSNREGFEKSKKLQIASATIQMLTGIATAMSGVFTTKTGPWDIALAAIQAGSIAASGIMNINKIKQTKFDGGGASASVSSAAVSNMVVPPIQYSNAVQGASTEGSIKDTKVYVTETDIKSTSNKVSVQESENTY